MMTDEESPAATDIRQMEEAVMTTVMKAGAHVTMMTATAVVDGTEIMKDILRLLREVGKVVVVAEVTVIMMAEAAVPAMMMMIAEAVHVTVIPATAAADGLAITKDIQKLQKEVGKAVEMAEAIAAPTSEAVRVMMTMTTAEAAARAMMMTIAEAVVQETITMEVADGLEIMKVIPKPQKEAGKTAEAEEEEAVSEQDTAAAGLVMMMMTEMDVAVDMADGLVIRKDTLRPHAGDADKTYNNFSAFPIAPFSF
jgi:hypothetical protein